MCLAAGMDAEEIHPVPKKKENVARQEGEARSRAMPRRKQTSAQYKSVTECFKLATKPLIRYNHG